MPFLSDYAKNKKISYFLENIEKDARILEIGSGSGWLKEYFTKNRYTYYTGIDLHPPADIVGSILDWKRLGIEKGSFDYIIAFEVIEHVNCIQECFDLVKPNGKLLMTSPVPKMDWFLCLLEKIGLNQKRTSPHTNLIDFNKISVFREKRIRVIAGLSQWGIFTR